MGIRDKPTAPASPWHNGFAERLIGSIRRECVDQHHCPGRGHLRRILKSYAKYYNRVRTRRSLNKDAPVSRPVQRTGVIVHARHPGRTIGLTGPDGEQFHRSCSHSENDVNGTRQGLSGPDHRCQYLLEVFQMFVVPLSGSSRSSSVRRARHLPRLSGADCTQRCRSEIDDLYLVRSYYIVPSGKVGHDVYADLPLEIAGWIIVVAGCGSSWSNASVPIFPCVWG
jgi:hypothetical protein